MNRRDFLLSAARAAALQGALAAPPPGRIGLVSSTYGKLARPASSNSRLDDPQVRDMVRTAIELSGGLAARVRKGSWVVVKPNIGTLPTQPNYISGDVTDMRVIRAILEYVARHTAAGRITLAEGGSYRKIEDPAADTRVIQNGSRVDLRNFVWAESEFPGFTGSAGNMIDDLRRRFPRARFDMVNLNYDGVRNDAGGLARIVLAPAANGTRPFGARPDYYVTNTIRGCDFLISAPVLKVHRQCGITACLKNYVGTAPRMGYAVPGVFSNVNLHAQHSVDGRIDPFIADLASFHPPDFVVVDAIRGLQFGEHNSNLPGQAMRHNMVFAGADPVAADCLGAYLAGFYPWDIEYLHMAQTRGMGSMDLEHARVAGDDAARLRERWGKPKGWYGRANREWLVTDRPESPLAEWRRVTSPTDSLRFGTPASMPGVTYAAAARVVAEGSRKAYLWMGARGRFTAVLNGEAVMMEENRTRYRVGQFQQPVELRSGENRLLIQVTSLGPEAQVSALFTGPRNDGDSLDGIRWLA